MKSAALVEILIGLLFVVGGALGCAWLGYDIAKNRAAQKIADQSVEIGMLKGSLSLAESINQGNASQTAVLKKTLAEERDRRQQQQAAAAAELAARADRIAQLERAADKRLESITKKANQDEDCADLRTLPVCDVVAERLWGDAATARPH